MFAYIVRRILSTIPVMAVVAMFVFALLHLSPGDPAAIIAGDTATPADIARIHQALGLDRPLYVQFGTWVWHLLHGDLGISIFTNLPVTTLIAQRVEPTVTLDDLDRCSSRCSWRSRWACWRRGRRDRGSTARSWCSRCSGFRCRYLLLAYVLIFIFAVRADCCRCRAMSASTAASGRSCRIWCCRPSRLAMVFTALIARMTRASMLDVLAQDYIRTAQAKGLANDKVLIGHALKNAAVPIATIIGIGVALLIRGVVVTETVFAIPGLGRLTVDAILRRDYPIIQGIILVFSAAYVLVNLLVDLSYTLLDPRIRY